MSNDQAATDAATAFCNKFSSCVPAFIQIQWGDVTICSTKFTAQLKGALAATGTSATAADLELCAQAIPGASCDDILERKLPEACRPKPGTLANGSACGDDAQCQGKSCKIAPGKDCGVCSTPVAAGGACQTDDECDIGLKCFGQVCIARVAAGGTCDAARPCATALACRGGTCAMPDPAGSACMPAGDTCDSAHGVFCNGLAMTCAQATFGKPGDACGFVSGGIVLCEAGGLNITLPCKGFVAPSPLQPMGMPGVCQAPAADGATCNEMTGPSCVPPSICVNGSCKVKDPSACR